MTRTLLIDAEKVSTLIVLTSCFIPREAKQLWYGN